jgi:hypothetical protein
VLTPDQLLSRLVAEYKPQMLAVHRIAVTALKDATDTSPWTRDPDLPGASVRDS